MRLHRSRERRRTMTRNGLIELAQRILAEDDPDTLAELIEAFDALVPHPAGSDLFLFPELEFGPGVRPSADEIVTAALNYREPVSERCPAACLPRRRPRDRTRPASRRACAGGS